MAQKPLKTNIEKLQNACLEHGACGIKGFGRLFRILDKDRSETIPLEEFTKAIQIYQLNFNPIEIKQIFEECDKDKNGILDYDEFLQLLRVYLSLKIIFLLKYLSLQPPMSKYRERIIHDVFSKLDKNEDGQITVADLKSLFDVRKNPKYINGEWTEEQCLQNFLRVFDTPSFVDEIVSSFNS